MKMKSANTKATTCITDIAMGECFLYNNMYWMRCEPRQFLKNSATIKDVMNRGDGFAVNLSTGDVTAWRRDAMLIPTVVYMEPQQ